jgi:serine/threonine protein kinase
VLHNDSKLTLNNDRKRSIALQTANAFLFIADSGVVHRDIKSFNVLVSGRQSSVLQHCYCGATD